MIKSIIFIVIIIIMLVLYYRVFIDINTRDKYYYCLNKKNTKKNKK